MTAELGQMAVLLAFALAMAQATLPLAGAAKNDLAMMRSANYFAAGQAIFILTAFLALTYCFVTSDFSVRIVAENSHTAKPLIYKIAGVWGNHEGSMLLWALILGVFGAMVAAFGANLPDTLRARALSVQGMIGAAFLAFIIFTSNPFDRLSPAPLNGADLNPLLQDPGLAFHPPFLYLGYVGFSVAFSFSVAALIEGRVDAAWARWVRPWVLAAWCFLTIGITLGSWWAYYELGWGGWWFWDPVENASFMPWLCGTALLHSALVVERRQTLVNWTILLGVLTFSLSLIGTFLVRSGVLTSVHAFAVDPARGIFILAILLAASGGALTLYAIRAPSLEAGPTFAPISREGALVFNNIVLIAAVATVFLGTFYPLLIDLLGDDKISVGPPFYNATFAPIMTPLLIAMSIGPLLKWRKDRLSNAVFSLRFVAMFAGAALALAFIMKGGAAPALGMAIAVWLVGGTLKAFADKIRLGKTPVSQSLKIAAALPGASYGLLIAHASMGVCLAGIVAMSSWVSEDIRIMAPGESLVLSGYEISLDDVRQLNGPNYEAERASFSLRKNGRELGVLISERRFYGVRRQQTTEAGIRARPFVNVYVALGDLRDGGWVVRSYVHPMASLIWFGALGMALGGFVSLSDRRFRIGARMRAPAPPPIRGAALAGE